jgi:hypothetical protein
MKYDIWKPNPTMWVVLDTDSTVVYVVTGTIQKGLIVRGYGPSDYMFHIIRSVVEQDENGQPRNRL